MQLEESSACGARCFRPVIHVLLMPLRFFRLGTVGRCVFLDGKPLQKIPPGGRARLIGYLPQHFAPHWDSRVAELMAISLGRAGGISSKTVIDEALRTHDLTQLTDRWWSTLSGGERARVLLAMVASVSPPVLLADEPAASLDVHHRLAMVQRLVGYGRQALVVVVMHDIDLAFAHFERVVLLSAGDVVAAGSADDLIHDPTLDRTFRVTFNRASVAGRTIFVATSRSD